MVSKLPLSQYKLPALNVTTVILRLCLTPSPRLFATLSLARVLSLKQTLEVSHLTPATGLICLDFVKCLFQSAFIKNNLITLYGVTPDLQEAIKKTNVRGFTVSEVNHFCGTVLSRQ